MLVKLGAAILASIIVVAAVVAFLVLDRDAAPTEALAAPRFIDVTASSGIEHAYTGRSHYFEGGGVAAFDCSGDGLAELFFAGGDSESVLYLNESSQDFAFSKLERPNLQLTGVTGGYPFDMDGDDITDLVVLRVGENGIFRGLGGCRFERVNDQWGIDGGSRWTVGFSATWHAEDRLPTLAFGNYLKLSDLTNEADLCAPNVLVRPHGDAYTSGVDLTPAWCTLSVLFSDWNGDGGADLRVTNDRQYNRDGEEQLWRVFEEQPVSYSRDEGWKLVRIWGMGIASYDLTRDGLPEVFLTSQADSKLQTLADGPEAPTYTDIAIRRGATVHRPYVEDNTLPSTGWHAEFQDVNNDGFVDLYVAKGNVDAMPNFAAFDPNNLLIGQADGTFVEGGVDAGIVHGGRTRGAAIVDLDGDGLLDLVEVNREESIRIWRNVGAAEGDQPEQMGNWVKVEVEQTFGVNSGGVGSVIELRIGEYSTNREITVGGGHASGSFGHHQFGLGPSRSADVRIRWPDGLVSDWVAAEAGSTVVLSRTEPGTTGS